MGAAPNLLPRDFREPAFHLIEPRGARGREMQVVSRATR